MFRQLSTTRAEGHTIGERETRGGEIEADACVRACALTSVLSLAAEVFQLDPWVWMVLMCGMVYWPGVGVSKCLSADRIHTDVPSLLTHACVCGGWKSGPVLCNEQPGFLLVQLLLALISCCAALKLQRSGDYSPASLLFYSTPSNNLCPFLLHFLTPSVCSLLMGASSLHFRSCFLLHV